MSGTFWFGKEDTSGPQDEEKAKYDENPRVFAEMLIAMLLIHYFLCVCRTDDENPKPFAEVSEMDNKNI